MSYCVHWLTASDCLPRTKMLQAVEIRLVVMCVLAQKNITLTEVLRLLPQTPHAAAKLVRVY
jgi:hypothetical protein